MQFNNQMQKQPQRDSSISISNFRKINESVIAQNVLTDQSSLRNGQSFTFGHADVPRRSLKPLIGAFQVTIKKGQ